MKDWVAKSARLYTFSDFSHRSWCYQGIFPKDKDFISNIGKLLLESLVKTGYLRPIDLLWVAWMISKMAAQKRIK